MHKTIIFDKLIATEKDALKLMHKREESLNNCLITYFNQHCYNIYSSNKDYQLLIDNYFNTYIDGIGILLALKFLRYPVGKSFNASDFK